MIEDNVPYDYIACLLKLYYIYDLHIYIDNHKNDANSNIDKVKRIYE